MDFLNNVLEMSPPVLLAFALNGVGYALKKSPIQNWIIYYVLPLIGAIVYPLIAEPAKVAFQVRYPVAFHAMIGFAIGTTAVWTHQAFRSFIDRITGSQDTTFLKRSEVKQPNKVPDPNDIKP